MLVISARLFAFLIISCTLFFSVSVNCVRTPFRLPSALPLTPAPDTSNDLVLTPLILAANSEGSSAVPNNSVACSRSASRTF